MKQIYLYIILAGSLLYSCVGTENKPRAYYIDNTRSSGTKDGSKSNPWQSFSEVDRSLLQAGDTIYLAGGRTFEESVTIDSLVAGTEAKPIVITSYGDGIAKIVSGDEGGLHLSNSQHVRISRLHILGSGRKEGNMHNGLFIDNCKHVSVANINVEGYQKSGLYIYASAHIVADSIYAHNNGYSGILVNGLEGRKDASHDIVISNSMAENNAGDPTVFNNHSGNGILVGHSTRVVVEYCAATNNGWDMPRIGNGPVGIWTYESDSVTIQYCIAYKNKTSKGGGDGGGFDLDGGVTNSVIQYCLSYENEGSGYGLFQYKGASPWYNNTMRYCISENDGLVSAARSGIFIWNSSDDATQLKDCYVYNNTIYNEKGAAISYEADSKNSGFCFYNNLFVGENDLITGVETGGKFLGNNWYSLSAKGFKVQGFNSLEAWAKEKNKEILDGTIRGLSIKPVFRNQPPTTLTDPAKIATVGTYQLAAGSPLADRGLNLQSQFGINSGDVDFNQKKVLQKMIGACQ